MGGLHRPWDPREPSFLGGSSSSGSRSDRGLDHHMLELGVLVEAVLRQLLAVAGLSETTKWHFRCGEDLLTDPDRSEIQVLRQTHRPAEIGCPYAGGQAVDHVIGHG